MYSPSWARIILGIIPTTLHYLHYTTLQHTTHKHTTQTMSKENISATVDPEVAAYLKQEHINISATVNKAVKQHMAGGGNDQVQEFLIRQAEQEVTELEKRTEGKKAFLQSLKQINREKEEERQEVFDEAIEKLKNTPRDPENPAIQTQADKLNMDPEDLIAELPEQDTDDLDSL